tara:strand:- start:3300 stop:3839 length:540 start_codon:yes stop_codon:yes gene_type:complete
VIACIAPWNVPLLMMVLKVAPALVMGNAVMAKPSEETPSSTSILAEVIAASDIPDGAFALLNGFGRDSTGSFLSEHPDVDAILFTGEPGTGSEIMRSAASNLREVGMELGGKNASLVFEDADMDLAIEGSTRSVFSNSWQIRDLHSPLAGAGISGVGEVGGRSSLEFCSQPQTITVRVK